MKITLCLLLGLFVSVHIRAQALSPTIINSTGGTGVINGIIYDYSFGEMTMIQTFSTPNLIVTQGLLQTRTDTAAMGIHSNSLETPTITVYPNPAQQLVIFESESPFAEKLNYELTDISGKMITNRELRCSGKKVKEEINLSSLSAGIYLLKITVTSGNQSATQTSKIQKNN